MRPLQLLLLLLCCLTSHLRLCAQEDYKKYISFSYEEIDSLMMLQYKKGAYDQCIPFMQAGMEKAKKEFGDLDSTYAEYYGNLGFFYAEAGQHKKALSTMKESLELSKKVYGMEHRSYTASLNNLARLHNDMGNYEQALTLFIESKNIREKTKGGDHPDFALSLHNLASLHKDMGNYELALPLFIQAKNIYQKALGTSHPNLAPPLNNLAALYKAMGNYEQALPLLIQTKNIHEKAFGIEHPNFANSLNNLATLYKDMGNYEQALPLFIQAKNIREKKLGSKHPSFAVSLNNLANLYQAMGNPEGALPLFIESKNIREKALGIAHPLFAKSLNNLAALHKYIGNYKQALPLYIQAKNIKEKALGVDHPSFAISLNNLAGLYKVMKDYELALLLYIQSKNIRAKALGINHPSFAVALNNLTGLYLSMGNYEEAWKTISQAIKVYSEVEMSLNLDKAWADSLLQLPCPSSPHLDELLTSLGHIYDCLKVDSSVVSPIKKQIIVSDLAIALLVNYQASVSAEGDKLRMLTVGSDWLQKSLNRLNPSDHSAKAFGLSDQNKSVLLLQATKSEEAYRLGELPDSLVWRDKKMLKKQSKLQAKLLENRSEEEKSKLRDELNRVNQNIEAFIELLKKEYPKYHKLRYLQVNAKVEEIQALLDENTALLEYVLMDSVIHIFYVDKKQVQWSKSFVANEVLREHIKGLHQALSDYTAILNDKESAYQKYTKQAHWFYQNLLQATLKDKKGIDNLIIITDGELGHLPFEAFLVEAAPTAVTAYSALHYLVNDYNLSYNYSATLWKDNIEAPAPKNNGQIFGVAANYELKLDSLKQGLRLPTDQWLRAALNPLPAARKEVELLMQKYQGFFAFDSLATERMVKAKSADYAILHFATHGILDSKRPMLSSLAFSEDGDSLESNFWQAHEISKIQLNANLVVLSACETGFGKFEKGNGIASLARAFMYAGAPSLVVSLWQVNDQATAVLMENFYDNLAKGMKVDEALRQAKLKYIQSAEGIAAHPAFWSPFIQIGKTEAIKISKKDAGTWIWGIGIGAGALLLLGLGGLVMRRRNLEG